MPTIIGQSRPNANAYTTPLLSASTNANAIQVSGTGTTAKIFPIPNSVIASGATTLPAVTLSAPGTFRLEGENFIVKAGGSVYVHGTSPTVALTLYYITNATFVGSTWQNAQVTPASWTVALASSGQSLVTANMYPWMLTGSFIADSMSQVITGNVGFQIGGNFVGAATVTNSLTSTGGMGLEPPVVFGIGVTFGVSDALNVAQLDSFYLEA